MRGKLSRIRASREGVQRLRTQAKGQTKSANIRDEGRCQRRVGWKTQPMRQPPIRSSYLRTDYLRPWGSSSQEFSSRSEIVRSGKQSAIVSAGDVSNLASGVSVLASLT